MSTDDVAELASLVIALADRLEAAAPPDAPADAEALETIRERAQRLASSERGPVRVSALAAPSITVTEPDGRTRMVLSGRGTFPASIQVAGRVIDHVREVAGMLFFSDEGDECGGLIFAGEDGHQVGSLTFDQYHQDQVIQVFQDDSPDGRIAALMVNDQPNLPLPELIDRYDAIRALPEEEQEDAVRALHEEGHHAAQRIMVGKVPDGRARVTLADADSNVRLALTVTADGTPSIEVFDADGEVVWQAP